MVRTDEGVDSKIVRKCNSLMAGWAVMAYDELGHKNQKRPNPMKVGGRSIVVVVALPAPIQS